MHIYDSIDSFKDFFLKSKSRRIESNSITYKRMMSVYDILHNTTSKEFALGVYLLKDLFFQYYEEMIGKYTEFLKVNLCRFLNDGIINY